MNPIFPLIVAAISNLVPATSQALSAHRESVQEATDRYESIARDLVEVVYRPGEPPLYEGNSGRIKTMALMLGIMARESFFRKDVDEGSLRGDGGDSFCMAQINVGGGKIIVSDDGTFKYAAYDSKEGWSGRDLVKHRTWCFRAQLAILRKSLECKNSDQYAGLNMYASGKCDSGYSASRNRMLLAEKVEKDLTFTDEDVQEELKRLEP